MNQEVNTYIDFLNATDWSVFQRSQPATWVDPFWKNEQISGDIADMFSDDSIDT